jgi:hypothetical protein
MTGLTTIVTDRTYRRVSSKTIAALGPAAQNAIQRKKDQDYLTVLDGATTSLCGAGTTLTTFTQTGGSNILNAAATVTAVNVLGGTLTSEGNYTVTTANVLGGTYYSNHIKPAAAAITTLNCKGGTTSTKQTNAARTFTTVNLYRGCTLAGDDDVVTITTLNEPDGPYSVTVS